MVGRLSVLVASAVVVFAAPALAGDRGSVEDQLACTPDVYRLCSQFVPDENKIVACLQRNVAQLSPDCHKVFTRPANGGNQNGDDNDTD